MRLLHVKGTDSEDTILNFGGARKMVAQNNENLP